MGWRKILAHSAGGTINMGNWYARYNTRDDSIDLEHDADGIPYVMTDNVFNGTHYYTEVVAGVLQIEQWPGWDDITTAQDETYILDNTYIFDDTASVSLFFDYLFGATSAMSSYEEEAVFTAGELDITSVDRYSSSAIAWVVDLAPVGTTAVLETSVFDGVNWSAWSVETNNSVINDMPVVGTNLSLAQYKTRYRVRFQSNATSETQKISEVKETFNSKKQIRVLSNGHYEYSQHIINSVPTATTKTL